MRSGLLLVCLFVYCFALGQGGPEKIFLNEHWYFSRSGEENWLDAVVPGTVHQDLLRHQMIPDPFQGCNEEEVQWVENEDWEYKTDFTVIPSQLARDEAFLDFEGLDTYADVYLNGALILRADNMFVGYHVPVKKLLREGKNALHIYFHSPIRQTLAQYHSNGFDYPADNDHAPQKLSVFTRKAPYSYGWDWGIRLVTCGVWRPVSLVFADGAVIRDFHIRQLSLTDVEAKVTAEVDFEGIASGVWEGSMTVTCSLQGEVKTKCCREVAVGQGENRLKFPLTIKNPERWMPNGWGKPVLYDFTVSLASGDSLIAEKRVRVGFRNLRVVCEKDSIGETFYFEVNGIPMFVKGANYIPADAFLPAMTTGRYQTLFRNIREANMNMIRVWGGGTYEDDRFYELADENGILIWQDFMFACTTYPHDPVFLAKVREEAAYNIRRLRNHACLAMWCGNNEILEGLKYWGWNKKYEPEVYEDMHRGYRLLFLEMLPSLVEQIDSGRFYMHGSPYFANWGRPSSWKIRDSHNWGVWYGRKPFESLEKEIPRFMSEFGFQAFPEMKTISTFAAPEDYRVDSRVMKAHQKSSIGNELIGQYMEREYIVPEKFEDFVYVGLVMQGQGISRGIKAQRRHRPYCMGSLYWQLNDSWPVVSWSGIDYYGNWKALHYQARRAFAPLLISTFRQKDTLEVWLVSDLLESRDFLTLEIHLSDFYGGVLKKEKIQTRIGANESLKVIELAVDEWVQGETGKKCFLRLWLKDRAGKYLAEACHFFNPPKDLDLPLARISGRVKPGEGKCEVTLQSDELAKDVFIEVPEQGARFSDNFFDLLPGEKRVITIESPFFGKGYIPDLKIRHLRDTYR